MFWLMGDALRRREHDQRGNGLRKRLARFSS